MLLILYADLRFPSSVQALSTVREFLIRNPEFDHILSFHVVDASQEPERLERDGIIDTPALIKQDGNERDCLSGDFSDHLNLRSFLLPPRLGLLHDTKIDHTEARGA